MVCLAFVELIADVVLMFSHFSASPRFHEPTGFLRE